MTRNIKNTFFRQLRILRKIFRKNPYFFTFVYLPVLLYVVTYLALKARSLAFITMVNPGIKMGGLIGNSKFKLNQNFDENLTPKAFLLEAGTSIERLEQNMEEAQLSFPVIMKPDLGDRGVGVALIQSKEQANEYLIQMKGNSILEEYIDTKEEYAIFYYRLPNQKKGKILSFVRKDFLTIEGDGIHTIEQLLEEDVRFDFFRRKWRKKLKAELKSILSKGQVKTITHLGNCGDGVVCKDLNKVIPAEILDNIDFISQSIKGFYFGRFDIRTNSIDDLKNGDFKIIELNGVNAIPLHIYDPDISFRQCYIDLFRHWNIACKIALSNRIKGIEPEKASTVLSEVFRNRFNYLFYPNL